MKYFANNFSKVMFYDKLLWSKYLSVLGVLGTLITLVSFFIPTNDLNIDVASFSGPFIIVLVVVFFVMWWKANHLNKVNLKINNTNIHISEGDIWELLGKKIEDRKGQISVIGVNDYYDTVVDNRIVAEKTLHGQYINRIVEAHKLDDLNKIIESDVNLNKDENREDASDRKVGRKVRYKIGSVVEFESYVLTAFAKFDENNKASLSADEYTAFWMTFWKNIDEIYAGRTINIPLMGAGITRFSDGKPTKQELLEVMLWTLKISGFHNTYGDKKINIVIYPPDVDEIDFYQIQHNLNFR